jgi:GTP cyclohydrolase I
LAALGADLADEGMRETPRRIVAAYAEMLTPRPFAATTFPIEHESDDLIVVRAIPFSSLCMHHLLPFHGVAHIGYVPGERILGLSKFARVVEFYSRDFQVQERLTAQIAAWVEQNLSPKGVGVVLEAEHLCMSLRGVKTSDARTVTSALRGAVRDDPGCRQQFLALTMDASTASTQTVAPGHDEKCRSSIGDRDDRLRKTDVASDRAASSRAEGLSYS